MIFASIVLSLFPLLLPVLAVLLAAAIAWTFRLRRSRPARNGWTLYLAFSQRVRLTYGLAKPLATPTRQSIT